MKKILIITNIPNPYRIPLFNELNTQLKSAGAQLKIIFAAENYSRRKSVLSLDDCSFEYSFLGNTAVSFGDSEKTTFSYKNLSKVFKTEKPDVIISSGFSLATLKAWWYTRFKKSAFVIWSGSAGVKGKGFEWMRRIQRRFLAGSAAAGVAYGSKAAQYLATFGMPSRKIFIALNTVDTSFFRLETAKLKEKNLNKDNLHHLTFVGYLSKRKKVDQLLNCMKDLAALRKDFVLDIVGDGDDRRYLEELAGSMGINERVVFHGFRQKEELPLYYSMSSVFLFQTGFDIWGLVLNEAMACGIPCIVSPNAGAAADLIEEGKNGFVADFADKGNVIEKINFLLDHPGEAKIIGQNAAEFIENNAGLKQSAEGFVKAINFALMESGK